MAHQVYKEVQRMRQTIFAYVFAGVFVLFIAGMIILVDQQWSDRTTILTTIGISVTVMFLLGWLMLVLKLEVKIEESRISYRMPPLINREHFIQRSDIESYEVIDYPPVRHYGGWGIRYSPKHGKALTISGSSGLRIRLSNGKQLLIGTRNKSDIEFAMRRMMENEEGYG